MKKKLEVRSFWPHFGCLFITQRNPHFFQKLYLQLFCCLYCIAWEILKSFFFFVKQMHFNPIFRTFSKILFKSAYRKNFGENPKGFRIRSWPQKTSVDFKPNISAVIHNLALKNLYPWKCQYFCFLKRYIFLQTCEPQSGLS